MAAGVMRDWATTDADRQRRDGARPDAARLRLPERRAGLATRRRASPTRSARRPPPRRSTARPSSRSAASTSACSPTGRTSTWSCGCAGSGYRCALAAGARGDPRALGDARLGLGAQELPDGLRARLRAAQVGRAHAAPAARRCWLRDGVLCAGQAVVDRNLAGVRGRFDGYRAAPRPSATRPSWSRAAASLGANLPPARRRRTPAAVRGPERRRAAERALAVFHLADTSGPSRSLEAELAWLAGEGDARRRHPRPGNVGDVLGRPATCIQLDYEALTSPPAAAERAAGSSAVWCATCAPSAADPRAAPRARALGDHDAAGGPDRGPARAGPGARLLRRAVRPRLAAARCGRSPAGRWPCSPRGSRR